jgi:hypothetical protein
MKRIQRQTAHAALQMHGQVAEERISISNRVKMQSSLTVEPFRRATLQMLAFNDGAMVCVLYFAYRTS